MSQNTLIGIILAVLIILGGAFLVTRTASAPAENTTGTPTTTGTVATSTTDVGVGAAEGADITTASAPVTVTYSDAGFSPKEVSIPVGSTVRFVNNSSNEMWVATAPHPAHTAYDGTSLQQHCTANTNTSFDQCTASVAGTVYSFTFTKAGTFRYHNHVRANDFGSVVVK